MRDSQGFLISFVSFIILVVFISIKLILRYFLKNKYRIVQYIAVFGALLTPMFWMFQVGLKWKFNLDYMPNQAGDDLLFSGFHIAWLVIMVISSILMGVLGNVHSKGGNKLLFSRFSVVDVTVFQAGVLLFFIEVFKQLIYANLIGGFDNYAWYLIPVQFCSIPIYLFLITPFIRNECWKRAFYSFTAIFALVGGLTTMIVASGVFISVVSISVHTMIWHGTMVVMSIYIIAAKKIGSSFKDFTKAIAILASFVIVVQIVNIVLQLIFPGVSTKVGVDIFYISPWNGTSLPVFGMIKTNLINTGMPRFLASTIHTLAYFVGFTIGGLIVFYTIKLSVFVGGKIKALKQVKKVQ